MNSMLRQALSSFYCGPLKQLVEVLAGENGDQWYAEFMKFLRKEPCWVVADTLEKLLGPTSTRPDFLQYG